MSDKINIPAIGFGVAANTSGTDYAPGFIRTAAKLLAGD